MHNNNSNNNNNNHHSLFMRYIHELVAAQSVRVQN